MERALSVLLLKDARATFIFVPGKAAAMDESTEQQRKKIKGGVESKT
jgi:hypothetical protein